MEVGRTDAPRSRKALSWFLALVLCIQMLGVSALQAFADEAEDIATAANTTLGKNLVYDDVYGVKHGKVAFMVKNGEVTDQSGAKSQAIVQVDMVNSAGVVVDSLGLDDAPSSYPSEADKAVWVNTTMVNMQVFNKNEGLSFCSTRKAQGDEVKYGFVSYSGKEVAPLRYDDVTSREVNTPMAAALDLNASVVDIYDANGVKTTSIPMPSKWSEGWTEGNPIVYINFDKTGLLVLNLNGTNSEGNYVSKLYAWDVASGSFVDYEREPGGSSTNSEQLVWELPDGGTVAIAKIDGQEAFMCTTPKGSFTLNGGRYVWEFQVFPESGLIQYSGSEVRVWDLSGSEITAFQGTRIEAEMGDGLCFCRENQTTGEYRFEYSIRKTDGTVIKALAHDNLYSFTSPFIHTNDLDGSCVLLDKLGNEVKRITPSLPGGQCYIRSSGVDGILVATESETQSGTYRDIARAAYNTANGEWLSAEVALLYARAKGITLEDGTRAYMLPVYDNDDGLINSQFHPLYYQYVDRDLKVISPSEGVGVQTPYSKWIEWQKAQRTLSDGTVMSYVANDQGKYGAVDAEGNELIPFDYDAYYDCGDDDSLILLKKGNAWEFFDTNTIDTNKEPVPATSVAISGAPEQLNVGKTAQLAAAVEPAGSTDKVTWTSSNKSVLTVDAKGLVTAVANGEATITATAGNQTDSVTIAVTTPATSVTISGVPEKPLNVGNTAQLTATVAPEEATDKVTWTSSDEQVLTVDADGKVTALGNGEATVTATAGEQTDTVTITVVTPASGIELDTQKLTLYKGDDASKLTATVLPATASNNAVTWTSSDDSVATVTANGEVSPVGLGTATITATTVDGGFEATCTVTVGEHVSGIKLDKDVVSLTGVSTSQLVATVSPDGALDKTVMWSTSDASVATVDDNGLVTAVGKGSATIMATSTDGELSASCEVTVSNPVTGFQLSAASVALIKGQTQDIQVIAQGALPGEVDAHEAKLTVEGDGTFANDVWSDASGNQVLSVKESVSADGMSRTCTITALGTGKGTLVYETQQGESKVRGVVAVSVTNPAQSVTLSETSKSVTVGDVAFTLSATVNPADADGADNIVWSTSDAKVATVAGGVVSPVSAGAASITAKVGDASATCTVTVASKKIASATSESNVEVSVDVTDVAAAEKLDKITEENGGTLVLLVQDAQDLTEAAQKAVESLQTENGKVADVLDISFQNGEGDEVKVDLSDDGLTMTVRVKMTDAMRALDPTTLKVVYVADDGTTQTKTTWVEGDNLCFTTEHFSTYAVTGNERQTQGGGEGSGSGSIVGGNGGTSGGGSTTIPGATKPLLAPTGDTPVLPLALTVFAGAAALVCFARVRSGRRVK